MRSATHGVIEIGVLRAGRALTAKPGAAGSSARSLRPQRTFSGAPAPSKPIAASFSASVALRESRVSACRGVRWASRAAGDSDVTPGQGLETGIDDRLDVRGGGMFTVNCWTPGRVCSAAPAG